jgi:hypothetical protein
MKAFLLSAPFIGLHLLSRGNRPAPRLAPAWPPVLSPSARVSDKARDGGVAERLKAHAWKVCIAGSNPAPSATKYV